MLKDQGGEIGMSGNWRRSTTQNRVVQALDQLGDITIKEMSSGLDLDGIPLSTAYRVHGVHVYVEFLNAEGLLGSTNNEGVRCHRRYLRFLHLYQRAVHLVVQATKLSKVDFQNHRLHAVVYEPFDDERGRIIYAGAAAALLLKLLTHANELHADIDDAIIAIGIESGEALAVRNGTRGDREPLFLGRAANEAAKMLAGRQEGILLGPSARKVLGEEWEVDASALLDPDELKWFLAKADLSITVDTLLDRWKTELRDTPLKTFQFSRATPPLKNLDLDTLSPKNSRRMELVSIFADIDGFSAFVAGHMEDEEGDPTIAVSALHIIRKELRDILKDFEGRKIRYHGDCLQGVLMEGTSQQTHVGDSVETALLCAGAMRSAFSVIQEEMEGLDELGLAIGFEMGPVSLTRLGIRGKLDRCAAGRAIFGSESLQRDCDGTQTQIGEEALKKACAELADLFSEGSILSALDYNTVVAALENRDGQRASTQNLAAKVVPAVITPRAFGASDE